jgi:hypothetical protein
MARIEATINRKGTIEDLFSTRERQLTNNLSSPPLFTDEDSEGSALLHDDATAVDGLPGGDDPAAVDIADVDFNA